MSGIDDGELRALLADPDTARPQPGFTADVLRRWGARQRLRRWLVRLLVGMGVLGPLVSLAPQALRSLAGLTAGSGGLGLALAGMLVLLTLGFLRTGRPG